MNFETYIPTLIKAARKTYAWYSRRRFVEKFGINFVLTAGAVYLLYLVFLSAPLGFPTGAYVKVEAGAPLATIARDLEQRNIIRSAFLFKVTARLVGDHKRIPAGEYFFPRGENLVQVAIRVVSGDFAVDPVRVTIQEGLSSVQIANLLMEKLPHFNKKEFLANAREGYLFPDTYFFMPGQSTEAILSVFNHNFRTQVAKVQPQIDEFGVPLEEVLIMASLLEKEASKTEDRRRIAGVLWRRIDIGMPLQVDAVFPYIMGKNTFELTLEDLQVDSPYNTYKYKGLPPGPIANPGLSSITAAVTPVPSDYVFFLSDKDGNFHYSATYAQHLRFKAQYLD